MSQSSPFKWRHYQPEVILCAIRWYLDNRLSYRHVEEFCTERGLPVDYTTVFRWVQRYRPELEKRCRRYVRRTNGSWRVDETYIKVKGEWKYLDRAVDSPGYKIDFLLTAKRAASAVKRFCRKALKATHNQEPRVINVNTNAAYPKAIEELIAEKELSQAGELRQIKYLNNLVEQDHRTT